MKTTTTTTTGLKVKSAIKAGGPSANHNRSGLKVKRRDQGRRPQRPNHNRAGPQGQHRRQGRWLHRPNHNRAGLKVKTAIKAGGLT